jgi:hypothetical protein
MAYKTSGKGFIGDFLSSVAQPLGSLGGAFFGPLGGIIGSGIGSAISPLAKRIPFKKGGVVKGMHMMPDGTMMKDSDMMMMKGKKKAKKAPAKGSKAMKMKMARLRAMRK